MAESEYISSLDGQQMDAALMDMAMHNSEAWATGMRNGVPVVEGDPTYHNNAQWFAGHISEEGKPPYIGDNGNWFVWDSAQVAYVDSGRPSRGITGEDAYVTEVAYAVSDSGITPPETGWQETIPTVLGGQFLWQRITWNNEQIAYINSRYGQDGTGIGDMTKAVYDSDNSVAEAGGIAPYVEANGGKVATVSINGGTPIEPDEDKNIDLTIPLGEGAVRYDEEQTLTDAQKEQARKNIRAGGTNPNLLDNPWFTVNQRGQSSWTGVDDERYHLDRWGDKRVDGSIDSNGLTISTSTGVSCFIFQRLEKGRIQVGQTITFSAIIDNQMCICTTSLPSSGTVEQTIYPDVVFRLENGNNSDVCMIWVYSATRTITIKAVKLELGSVSTLANDVAPDYATELLKCQRYFIRIRFDSMRPLGIALATGTTNAFLQIPMPIQMRENPSITIDNTLSIYGDENGHQVTNYEIDRVLGNSISIRLTSTGLTNKNIYACAPVNSATRIFLSADL